MACPQLQSHVQLDVTHLPRCRLLAKRLPGWADLPPLLVAVSDALSGSPTLAARAAAAEAAAASLLEEVLPTCFPPHSASCRMSKWGVGCVHGHRH
jgi:hypothetical protein